MQEFPLNSHEYIELNKLLKLLNLAETGGEANIIITNGEVFVNGTVEIQKRKKLRKGDKVNYKEQNIIII